MTIFNLNTNIAESIFLNVTTNKDENDGSELSGNGLSLREAILIANADPENEYTIILPAGTYDLTIKNVLLPTTDTSVDSDTLFRSRLSTGDLDITGNITIIGDDPNTTIINAGTLTQPNSDNSSGTETIGDRVFDVLSSERSLAPTNGNLTLKNITIQNGIITDENIDATYQGGTLNGGALNVDVGASATMVNSIIENSRTVTSQGGGINNSGTLTLDRTIVRGNNSGDNAGGIYNDQNAILTIYNSAIINNLADAAAPDIIEGGGGGVLNEINATLTIVNTTISGNRSASGENQDGPGDGGGGILSRGTTRIINSTIVNNFAQVGSGIYSETTNANTILFNTIVGNNSGSPDLDGFFDDRSAYNLISNGNGQGILDDRNNNIVGGQTSEIIELDLGPLEDNGGPTPTHALLNDSLAIDSGSNEINGEFIEGIEIYFPLDNLINGRATDQRFTEITTDTGIIKRGFERIAGGQDGIIDIGAFEFGAVEIEEFIENEPNNLNGSNNANSNDDNNGNNNSNNAQSLDEEINSNSNSNDSLLNTPLFRLQNSDRPGTYLYASEAEKTSILANYTNFINEGFAFNVSSTPDDDLIAFYRFQNADIPGTYLYASEAERLSILANYDNFKEEGLAFYAYDGNADLAQDVYRLQNRDQPGTYLFVGAQEKDQILATYDNYVLEGVAFEASFIQF